MIPLSPRTRTAKALSHFTFTYDATAVEQLEAAVSAYHGSRFAVAFNTPESALFAALTVARITPEDTLKSAAIAPLYHFTAMQQRGVNPHFADIGLDGMLDTRRLDPDTLSGNGILLLASFAGVRPSRQYLPGTIPVIEDLGTGLSPDGIAGMTLWSLEGLMPAGVEKSGFVLTDDPDEASELRRFRGQGFKQGAHWNYDLTLPGTDAALSAFSATVALDTLKTIQGAQERTHEHLTTLTERLKGHHLFDLLDHGPGADTFSLLLTPQLYCPKEDIFTTLSSEGVEAGVCCKPVYKTTRFKREGLRLEVTEDFFKALLQLPCHHRLEPTEVETIAQTLLRSVETYGYRGCRF